MSHGKLSIVKIKTDDGYAIINESDFNEKEYKLFVEKADKKADADKKKADKKAD